MRFIINAYVNVRTPKHVCTSSCQHGMRQILQETQSAKEQIWNSLKFFRNGRELQRQSGSKKLLTKLTKKKQKTVSSEGAAAEALPGVVAKSKELAQKFQRGFRLRVRMTYHPKILQ